MLDDGLVNVARERTRAAKLPHNVAREHFEGYILNTLTDMLAERIGTEPWDGSNLLDPSDMTQIRDELAQNPEVARERADAALAERIRAVHTGWDGTYGRPGSPPSCARRASV